MPTPFLLLLLLFLALASTSGGQSYSNITRGTVLTASGSPDSWPSPSGEFAFGFFPADSNRSHFLLAFWFAATSPQSVVWSANRNALLASGATVRLTADGRFSLRSETGSETWNPGAIDAVAASVLDTGNLVLADGTGVLWQSFDEPTDTLLPRQVLRAGASLRSQLTDADFSEGRFSLMAQDDGNLVLYPLALPTGNQYVAYWATGTSGAGNQLVYNASGSIYYNATANGTIVAINANSEYSPANFYQCARLDPDGVFRLYVYPKNNSGGGGRRVIKIHMERGGESS